MGAQKSVKSCQAPDRPRVIKVAKSGHDNYFTSPVAIRFSVLKPGVLVEGVARSPKSSIYGAVTRILVPYRGTYR